MTEFTHCLEIFRVQKQRSRPSSSYLITALDWLVVLSCNLLMMIILLLLSYSSGDSKWIVGQIDWLSLVLFKSDHIVYIVAWVLVSWSFIVTSCLLHYSRRSQIRRAIEMTKQNLLSHCLSKLPLRKICRSLLLDLVLWSIYDFIWWQDNFLVEKAWNAVEVLLRSCKNLPIKWSLFVVNS